MNDIVSGSSSQGIPAGSSKTLQRAGSSRSRISIASARSGEASDRCGTSDQRSGESRRFRMTMSAGAGILTSPSDWVCSDSDRVWLGWFLIGSVGFVLTLIGFSVGSLTPN